MIEQLDSISLPSSAVDAHVGKALFTEAILGALRAQGKTVILVTHALHFLSQCDYIYTMADGRIVEHGTYSDLLARGGDFARLSKEFGGEQEKEEGEEVIEAGADDGYVEKKPDDGIDKAKLKERLLGNAEGKGKLEGRLIIKENRTTGAVPWHGAYVLRWEWGRKLTLPIFSLWDVPKGRKGGIHLASRSAGHGPHARKHSCELICTSLVGG